MTAYSPVIHHTGNNRHEPLAGPDTLTLPDGAVPWAAMASPFSNSGVGAPTGATPVNPPYYVNTGTTPDSLYWYDGASWNLLGDGAGTSPVQTGLGVPTGATPVTPPFYVDSTAVPDALYWYDGAAWNLLGDGVGAATNNTFRAELQASIALANNVGIYPALTQVQGASFGNWAGTTFTLTEAGVYLLTSASYIEVTMGAADRVTVGTGVEKSGLTQGAAYDTFYTIGPAFSIPAVGTVVKGAVGDTFRTATVAGDATGGTSSRTLNAGRTSNFTITKIGA